jgi:hypothetical protein
MRKGIKETLQNWLVFGIVVLLLIVSAEPVFSQEQSVEQRAYDRYYSVYTQEKVSLEEFTSRLVSWCVGVKVAPSQISRLQTSRTPEGKANYEYLKIWLEMRMEWLEVCFPDGIDIDEFMQKHQTKIDLGVAKTTVDLEKIK